MIDRQTFVRDSIGPYFYFPTAGSFCDEYQAVINRAVAEGIRLPSPARQRLDNRKILRMQDEYLWSDLDIFFSFHTDRWRAFGAGASLIGKEQTLNRIINANNL